MAKIENTFRYSYSRNGVSESCLRKYFFSYYFHWEGWLFNGDLRPFLEGKEPDNYEARRKIAYIYKKSQNIYSFTGDRVHQVVEGTLEDLKKGIMITDCKPFVSESIQKFEDDLDTILAKQAELHFLSKPKDYSFFQEFLNSSDYVYGFPNAPSINWSYFRKQARDLFVLNLVNYFRSGLYQGLIRLFNSSKSFCIEREIFHNLSFECDDKTEMVRLSVKPDLFIVSPENVLSIYDWKTGSKRNVKMDQLQYYGYLFSKLAETHEEFAEITGYRLKVYCLKEKDFILENFNPSYFDPNGLIGNLKKMSLLTDTGLQENKISPEREEEFGRKINKGKFGCKACPMLKICPKTAQELGLC